ncbi:MAG: ABC-F family ATP-binding cassette domain-containing protein, partial [Bacteroides sp.]
MATLNSILQVEGLTKSFGDLVLLENVSFGLAEGQRVGLIAKNGTGKSTLLNILSGREGYDEGKISFRRDLRVGYLEQNPCYPEGLTVLEACFHHGNSTVELIKEYEKCMATEGHPGLDDLLLRMEQAKAWEYELKAKQILSQLKINDFDRKVKHLSGGQLKRVALAHTLIVEPDLLILDEPTNHLDLDMTEWLEEYLRRSNLTLLMVTHDRYFLDRVCSEIIEIDHKQLYHYKGNYSYYLEKRQERMDAKTVEVERARNLYRTELDWMRRMPQARGHKARYREEAFYELEKVAKQHFENRQVKLDVKASYIGNKIFEADHLCKSFGNLKILDDFSYIFARYEKMGIVGDNGTGKSTFIKILMGLVKPDSGTLDIGETVRFGYYSQEGLQFDEQMKVIDVVRDIAEVIELNGGQRFTASQFLQHFLFSPETQHSYVYKLSGGERRRLYLCTVLMRNPNFLVLDEPTNDLDIVTLQVLEEYLQNFKGCVIVVSHDRYFMDKVVDHLMVFNGQGDIRDFPGNYTQYRAWKEARQEHEREQANVRTTPAETKTARRRTDEKRRLTFKERREMEQLEQEVAALEAEKKQLEEELCSGTLSVE